MRRLDAGHETEHRIDGLLPGQAVTPGERGRPLVGDEVFRVSGKFTGSGVVSTFKRPFEPDGPLVFVIGLPMPIALPLQKPGPGLALGTKRREEAPIRSPREGPCPPLRGAS